jgi:arylsulfatase A
MLATARTILIDAGITTQSTTGNWNNFGGPSPGQPANIANLIDDTGAPTGISLTYTNATSITNSVSGTAANYAGPYPAGLSGIPASALQDGLFRDVGTSFDLVFANLDPGSRYSFTLYGARGNDGGQTIYTATGSSSANEVINSVLNNSTEFVILSEIQPTGTGVITLTIAATEPNGTSTQDGSLNFIRVDMLSGSDDTDEDDMPDSWEDANGLNKNDPDDADLDHDTTGGPDGLTNLEEYQNGTDPQDSDSDNDMLKDGDEVRGTLNPWTAGIKGTPPGNPTDPKDPDSDNDGVDDGVEIAAGSDPNAPPPNTGYTSPFVDTDGDSYRNEAETALGSNPNDPDDCPDHTPAPAKPNVVIIYADDMGFGDISRYGALFGTPSPSPTPNVDRLADQGVTFTQAHSANAVCTPSRYSLLTGIYNWRNFQGISMHYGFQAGIDNIPLDSDVTLAEFLKLEGYDTAAFGKWHLGGKWYAPGTSNRITDNPTNPAAVDWTRRIEGHATDIGFDYFRGLGAVINFGPYVYLHDDIVQYWVNDSGAGDTYGDKLPNGRKGFFRPATSGDSFTYLTTTQLNSSVVGATDSRASLGDPAYRQIDAEPIMIADFERYIDERAAASDPDPFFAYVALYSPHKPWAITPEFNNATYGSYDYARFMAEVDDRIGRIIAAIDDKGMADNTVIILTSDNGPETTAMTRTLSNGADANGPLRGAKRDVWDGGTRVPFIVRWPDQAPAGMVVTDEVISQVDIFPTIAAFLGEDLPATTAPDGESFLNVLRGQQKPGTPRGGVMICSISGHLALKTADGWKLIDSTGGGGNSSSWDADNNTIPNAIGTDQGTPKQLFQMPVDLGEKNNRISSLTTTSTIRSELVNLTGRDLLAVLDQLRTTGAASLDGREPDNDADGMSNSFETTYGLDRDSPKDAVLDNDGDGADNLSESIAGTDPNDPGSIFRVINLQESPASFSVTWPSVAGRSYEVFWSTDLDTWTSNSTHPGTGADIAVSLDKSAIDATDAIIGNLRAVFVRVNVTNP